MYIFIGILSTKLLTTNHPKTGLESEYEVVKLILKKKKPTTPWTRELYVGPSGEFIVKIIGGPVARAGFSVVIYAYILQDYTSLFDTAHSSLSLTLYLCMLCSKITYNIL